MKIKCKGTCKVFEITCMNCNSDLEYTEKDVFYIKEERQGGLRKTVTHLWKPDEHYVNVYMQQYRCIKCPVCGNIIKRPDFSKGLPSIDSTKWKKERKE